MSELPSGWVVTPLGKLLHAIEAGQNVKCAERAPQENEAGLVKISAVTWGQFDEEASKTLLQDASVNERHRIRPGDLLISRANTIELVGASVIVGPIEKRLYLSDKVLRLVVDEPAKRWVNYALKTPQLRQAIQGASTGNQLSMRNIPQEKLRSLEIPLAPAAEQTRTADQLDTLLARIQACNDRLDAIPALLKRFRQATVDAAVAGDLVEGLHTSEVPSCKLGEVLAEPLRNGKSVRDGAGLPVLRLTSIRGGWIDLTATKTGDWSLVPDWKRFLVEDGDYLVARGNGSKDLVGRGGIVRDCTADIAFPDTMIRIRPNKTLLLPGYLRHVWGSRTVREQIERAAKTTAGIWKLSQPDLEGIRFPLPAISVQQAIVDTLDTLLVFADSVQARYETAQRVAMRLAPQTLTKAFRGDLVPQDPNDEPASVLLQRLAKTSAVAVKTPRGRPRNTPANPSTPLPAAYPDWAALPSGAWAADGDINEHTTTPLIVAVLRAWGQPMPQDQARLAVMLCLQPRLFTAALPARDANLWRRLVGAEAEPLPASVAALQPAINAPWGRALGGLRARGDVVTSGPGPTDTWSLGPGVDRVETAGGPDGRAAWVVAYLRAHGVEAILPLLPTAAVDFVHARAA